MLIYDELLPDGGLAPKCNKQQVFLFFLCRLDSVQEFDYKSQNERYSGLIHLQTIFNSCPEKPQILSTEWGTFVH